MKSPFPGMDPYLDSHWRDVGASFVVCARSHMRPGLPADLVARIQYADAIDRATEEGPGARRWIALHPKGDGAFITAVKFMTPADLADPECRAGHRDVREDLLSRQVNLVEICLFRATPGDCYSATLLIPAEGLVEVQPLSFREHLPKIRIPLRPGDPRLELDLQPLVSEAYELGRYDDIDYTKEAEPPLLGDDAAWADELLRRAGKR